MGLSTFTRIKRGAAVGAGVIAVSLASALPADAALGGAKPGTLTLVPNLVSVSVSGSQAVYRFDRALEAGSLTGSDFTLRSNALGQGAGYTGLSATVNGSTVRVGFGSDQDLTKAVAGEVATGAVATDNAPTRQNINDAAPVTTSGSTDGTRGVSAAPTLVSVARESTQTLVYTFDRELAGTTADPTQFAVSDAGTNETNAAGGTATIAENTVKVTFPNGTTTLNNAQSAFVGDNFVSSASPVAAPGNGGNIISRVALPGKTETTGRADLTGAALVPASFGFAQTTSVEFTFDDAVTSTTAGNFSVVLANGQRIAGTSASVDPLAPSKVVVNFDNASGEQEYAVAAVAATGAVTTQNGVANAANNADLGGNTGASAAGFTVAPEVLGVARTDTNQFAVTIDTRLANTTPGPVFLVTGEGALLSVTSNGTPASSVQGQPGQKVVFYDVPAAADLADAKSVFVPDSTFVGKLGGNVPQVIGF